MKNAEFENMKDPSSNIHCLGEDLKIPSIIDKRNYEILSFNQPFNWKFKMSSVNGDISK